MSLPEDLRSRILLFGSVIQPELFHGESDIDLAVEGIPWPDYLRAWNEAEGRADDET